LDRASRALWVYADRDRLPAALEAMNRGLREQLADAGAGSDRQLVLARALVGVVGPDEHGFLADVVCGRSPWAGLEVDPDLRWRAVLRIAESGGDIDDLLGVALDADTGDYGRRNALTAEAARRSATVK